MTWTLPPGMVKRSVNVAYPDRFVPPSRDALNLESVPAVALLTCLTIATIFMDEGAAAAVRVDTDGAVLPQLLRRTITDVARRTDHDAS